MTSAIPDRPDAGSAVLGRDIVFDDALRQAIETNLLAFDVIPSTDTTLKRAAVTVCIVANEGGMASVLLTFRPPSLNRHASQYALPGGRLDDGETDVDAALRELREELNLSPGPDSLLGRLDTFQTDSGYCITPFVSWVEDATLLKPSPDEVAQVFPIPFSELLSPDIPHIAADPVSGDLVFSAPLRTVGHHVFAPTAAILYQFREVAILGRSTRVAGAGQPDFARR